MIDFHTHLDLYPDPGQVISESVARGLHVLSVTTTPSAWTGTAALAKGASRIRTALGLHPQIAHERKAELSLFEELLPEARYVGEIGLDGSPELRAHWENQQTILNRILTLCASEGGRIMSLHSRRAVASILDMLAKHRDAGTPVLHWFAGTQRQLRTAIDLGCWFSVGPAMLVTEKGRALAAMMPRKRLLTESDGPFAQIQGRAAVPWDVDQAIAVLAHVWSEEPSVVEAQLNENLGVLARIHA